VARACAVGTETGEAGSLMSGPECHSNGRRRRFDSKFEFKRIQINFKSFQTLTGPKKELPELKIFEIKYCYEGFEERNNFLHRNFSRLKMDFELKFRDASRFEIQYNLIEFLHRIFKFG
jgi:hypothetical protein